MAFDPWVILVILVAGMCTLVCGTLTVFVFLNVNIAQILKDMTGTTKTNASPDRIDEFMVFEDISPSKTVILKVPAKGYEIVVNKILRAWNGMIFFLQADDIVYAVNDKSELQMDDEIAHIKGDDYIAFIVNDTSYKSFISNMITYRDLNLARYKYMVKESYKDDKELLKQISDMVKEARKSMYSQPSSQSGRIFPKLPFSSSFDEENNDQGI